MNEPLKKLLLGVMALVLIAVCAVMFLTGGPEPIPDTNGPDDYSLTTISDQDILENTMGCLNFTRSTTALSDAVRFHSDNFSGVQEIMWTDILFSTGVQLQILDFEVHAGNFKMAVVNEGEIIRVIEPGEDFIELGEITGHTALVIAGESAAFSFRMPRSEYDSYSHRD